MYSNAAITTGTTGVLAFTGADNLWMVSAGFTLVFAGLAVKTILPRLRKRTSTTNK